MWMRFTSHLYVRIWLAVVATVLVLAFAVGAAWRLSADPPQLPIREVLVQNQAGETIGRAQTRADRKRGDDLEFDVQTRDGQILNLVLPRPKRPPSSTWSRAPFGFGWMLGLVALAVALGTYPIVRRLTQRLEGLQRGVERWGSGDLSARVTVHGSDEVAFLAERFNHAAERIETLMETQKSLLVSHKSLLANASHELRSPLARIRMGLELMDSGANSTQRAEISRSINELDQLIDEILLASRLDARQADTEPFEMLDLTGLAAEECARMQAELGTAMQTHSLMLQGSARLLRRLIRNLLENARRYGKTPETGIAMVDIAAKERDQWVLIKVRDHGTGVAPNALNNLTKPFFRGDAARTAATGAGLGLAIVEKTMHRMGGVFALANTSSGGLAAHIKLRRG